MIEQAVWGSRSRRFARAAWGGRPARLVLVFGGPAALLVALHQLVVSESLERALVVASANGLLVGLLMSRGTWKRWPGGRRLDPAGRVAVARAVGRGRKIADPQLVPAVVEYAACVRSMAERDWRLRWVVRVVALWPVPWAAVVGDDGPRWVGVAAWLFALVTTAVTLLATRAIEQRSANADRAAARAREHFAVDWGRMR